MMKAYLITALACLATLCSNAQSGGPAGVVTANGKPDIGARVYLIDSAKVGGFRFGQADSFELFVPVFTTHQALVSLSPDDAADLKPILQRIGLVTQKDYDAWADRYSAMLSAADLEARPSAVVDGSGRFALPSLAPGTYYLLAKSKAFTATDVAQIDGAYRVQRIKVPSSRQIQIDFSEGLSVDQLTRVTEMFQ